MFPGWSRMKCNTCSVSLNFERIMRKTGLEWVARTGALTTLLHTVSEFANPVRARLRMNSLSQPSRKVLSGVDHNAFLHSGIRF